MPGEDGGEAERTYRDDGRAHGAGPRCPLLPLPAAPYDPSDRHTTRVSSLSLVRYRTKEFLMLHSTLGTRAPRPGSLRSTTVIDNIFQTTRPWQRYRHKHDPG